MYALVALLGLLVAVLQLQVFVFRRRGSWCRSASPSPRWSTPTTGVCSSPWAPSSALVPAVASHRTGARSCGTPRSPTASRRCSTWCGCRPCFQAAHTGAPWSEKPGPGDVLGPITGLLGGQVVPRGSCWRAGPGRATSCRRRAGTRSPTGAVRRSGRWSCSRSRRSPPRGWRRSSRRPTPGATSLSSSGPAPARGHRARPRRAAGLVALAIILALWFDPRTGTISHKSDVRTVAANIRSTVQAGDLVVTDPPRAGPADPSLHAPRRQAALRRLARVHPRPADLRLARRHRPPEGRAADADGEQDRVDAASPASTCCSSSRSCAPASGRRPWTSLVKRRVIQWERVLDNDPRMSRTLAVPSYKHRRPPRGVRMVLYERY